MLAPSAASLLRYGACPLPITLERCLFSKMTTTMWSGCGTVGLCSLGEGCRTVGFCFSGENGCSIRLNLGGGGCARALVSFGCVGTAVGSLSECTGGPVDGGSATPQAAHVSIKTAQQANRGKACTWNPLLIQVLADHHSTQARPQSATLRWRPGTSGQSDHRSGWRSTCSLDARQRSRSVTIESASRPAL